MTVNPTLDPAFRASLGRYLTQDIIDALPDRRAYNKASRHLNTLRVALSSFLPKYIADQEDLLLAEYSDLRQGTFMFADVSGFTALSEKLQQATGVEGAEILTQIINDFFSTMLEILAKSDGQMLKFAGDALLTFFPITGDETKDPAITVAAKAIRTGLRMQRSMQERFQPIQHPLLQELFGDHNLELTMSIGLSQGHLFEALVGNSSQRDHMVMGRLPGRAMAAEEAGIRDDVIIDNELATAFQEEFTLQPTEMEGFYTVVDNLGDDLSDFELTSIVSRRRSTLSSVFAFADDSDPLEDLRHLLTQVDNHARFVAKEVVNKLAIEGDRVEPQNRPATVIFAYFRGIADMLEVWGAAELPRITHILNRFYSMVQQTIAAYGGSLTRSDPYKDGSKLLITFGAPIAHPDDPFRAVSTCLELLEQTNLFNQQLHKEMPADLQRERYIELRAGIAHGQAFAGEVGWKQRREYTVMGDDVNLAARLMAHAQMGQIWISERIYRRVERFFEIERLEPVKMKGKTKPVQIFSVTGWKPNIAEVPRTSNTKFVGRDTLMLTTELAIEQVRAQRRRVIALVGQTGMGKTRIAKQILHEAEKKGFAVAWATCHTMDNARAAWDTLLTQLIGFDQDDDVADRHRTLRVFLDDIGLPDLEPALSLVLFGHDPTTPEAEQGHSASRSTAHDLELPPDVTQAVSQVVGKIIDEKPVLIVLDDLHKTHPMTLEILQDVLETLKRGRLLVIVAYEPGFDMGLKETEVDDLSEDETFRIAAEILHAPTLSHRLCNVIWDLAHGRPLYVEALLQQWQEQELIQLRQGTAELEADHKQLNDMPDFVRNVVISGIDRLPIEQQNLAHAAAVIASQSHAIPIEMVLHMAGYKQIEDGKPFLDLLKKNGMLIDKGKHELHFRYGLNQRAIYETLTRMQRQRLHDAAAQYLQGLDNADAYIFLIVEHLAKSGKVMSAIELIERAAEVAEQQEDYESAIEFYERALALFPNDRSLQVKMGQLVQKVAQFVSRNPIENRADTPKPKRPRKKVDPLSVTAVVRTVLGDEEPKPDEKKEDNQP